jgi:hypothetical protein
LHPPTQWNLRSGRKAVLNTLSKKISQFIIIVMTVLSLLCRGDEGGWEDLEKTAYSIPPELPDVMKPGQDTAATEQTIA